MSVPTSDKKQRPTIMRGPSAQSTLTHYVPFSSVSSPVLTRSGLPGGVFGYVVVDISRVQSQFQDLPRLQLS